MKTMHSRFNEPVLNQPIEQLGLGNNFSLTCELAGFHSRGELLERHSSELLKLPGFTCHLLGEYINFLEMHKLAHYIDAE